MYRNSVYIQIVMKKYCLLNVYSKWGWLKDRIGISHQTLVMCTHPLIVQISNQHSRHNLSLCREDISLCKKDPCILPYFLEYKIPPPICVSYSLKVYHHHHYHYSPSLKVFLQLCLIHWIVQYFQILMQCPSCSTCTNHHLMVTDDESSTICKLKY